MWGKAALACNKCTASLSQGRVEGLKSAATSRSLVNRGYAAWDRRTSRAASVVFSDTLRAPKPDARQSRSRSVRSDRTTTKRNFRRIRAMLRQADVKCVRSVAVAIASLRLSRHACADRPWWKHVMMTGNRPSVTMVTITFVDVDMSNTVYLRT